MTPPSPPVPGSTALRATMAGVVLLAALCVLWESWLAPLRPGGTWLWLKALPLLLVLPGLRRGSDQVLLVTLLVVLLYFVEAILRVFDPPPVAWMAWAELVLSLQVFASAALALRASTRARKQRAGTTA